MWVFLVSVEAEGKDTQSSASKIGKRHVRVAVAVNRKWLVRIPSEGQIAGLLEKTETSSSKFMAKICPSLCVRMPAPHMNWTYLNLAIWESEQLYASHLTWQPALSILSPGVGQSLALWSPVPFLITDTLGDCVSQPPLQLGLGHRIWDLETLTWWT